LMIWNVYVGHLLLIYIISNVEGVAWLAAITSHKFELFFLINR
jgi:hypothetical protein